MRLIDADKLVYDDIDCKDGHTYTVVRAFEIDSQPTIEVPQLVPCSEELPKETDQDAVNPNHYKNQCSLECIDAMIMAFGSDTVYYFCICNAWKYMWRYQNKNGVEDIKKARWYVDKASELIPEYLEWQNINHILIEIEMKMTERGESS